MGKAQNLVHDFGWSGFLRRFTSAGGWSSQTAAGDVELVVSGVSIQFLVTHSPIWQFFFLRKLHFTLKDWNNFYFRLQKF